MFKNSTNLNRLYIRLQNKSDGELMKSWAKDYYECHLMSLKTYNFWLNRNYDVYFESKEKEKMGLADGALHNVFCYTYVLLEENSIIGIGSLRLNPEKNLELSKYGGHIGYGIIPSKRNQGYGTLFLHLLIKKALFLGLKEIMVVCKKNNSGSFGVIENNFGVLKDIVFDQKNECYLNRYTIDVENSIHVFERKYKK